MSSILLHFPAAPRRSHMTVLEQDGQLKDAPESLPFNCLPDYPEVTVQSERNLRMNVHYDTAQNAFLPHQQTSWKKLLYSWYSGGLINVLEEMSENKYNVPTLVHSSSKVVLGFLQKLRSLKLSLFPQILMSNEDFLLKFTQISNWHKSPIQALAWHPHVTKLALALRDNSVVVYSSGSNLNPTLKHRLQKQVTVLAWQPLSSSVLAVGCQSCILIWLVEPTSLAIRPSSSTVQILHTRGHGPVMSLAWSTDSDFLISASPRDPSIMVWDVPKETAVALRRDRRGGVALLSCSPDGSKVFTSTLSPLFRVWEVKNWNSEVWSQLSGRCTASCWSPDGTFLIFAMDGDTGLYGVKFRNSEDGALSAASSSIMLADVSEVSVETESLEQIRVGGQVRQLAWDSTGERLAVLFETNELGNNHLVAVFKVNQQPVLELLPGGFIKGHSGESAHHIAFQPSFERGALLSVVWSSGRVAFIPMYFVSARDIQQLPNQLELDPWSSFTVFSPR